MQQFTYFTNKPRGCLVGLTFGGPLHVQVHEWLINAGSRVKIRVDVDQLVRPARPGFGRCHLWYSDPSQRLDLAVREQLTKTADSRSGGDTVETR